ncbi:hypothetical protein BD780_001433 [Clostridium tetanomorphum]|uniref:Transglutaminase-like domain-containing protein n=1 Tax=Clostridium tetanomorphum TaxID=1553 RepID=A0A923E8C0_CLOTT|nr:transglutaminase domain-containing protein [Clostridium tetanomorphum]KAJ53139.1 copper amine oxidase-like domain-containing protein [Clostridium tetanomorphum DSM 665]MBC2396934.1 hypothetical protein [Clostridium tetanomorphum]MBP1863099.1 hypothetical protein [Clostridium tetanomorphum]NRS84208.1 hypothetical protein [Clostridium tetanomorphum]NRZ97421.1 hypothetical protein [Clostridium tetanomorphum]
MKNFSKKLRIIFIIVFLGEIFIPYSFCNAASLNVDDYVIKDVSTNKVWNVLFNSPLEKSTVNEENIYVYDNKNNRKKTVNLQYDNKTNSVRVIPNEEYEDKGQYDLYIRKGIKAYKGNFLKNEKKISFQTLKNFNENKLKIIDIENKEEVYDVLLNAIKNKENNIVLNMKKFDEISTRKALLEAKNKINLNNSDLNYYNNLKTFYSYDEDMKLDLSKVMIYIDYFYFINNSFQDYDFTGDISCRLDKKVMLPNNYGKITLQSLKEKYYITNVSYSVDQPNVLSIDDNGNIKALQKGEGNIKVQYRKNSRDKESYNAYDSYFYIPIKVASKDSKIINNEDEFIKTIEDSLYQGKDEIDIYINNKWSNAPQINTIINNMFKEDYTGFYSIANISYDFTKINIKYPGDISKEKYLNIRKSLHKKADEIIGEIIKPNMSELEKEYAIHDYIVKNTVYDYDNFVKGTVPKEEYYPYGILLKKKGVCNGYALTMKMLLNKAKIECERVEGTTVDGEHAWNIVKINNNYYHVDATWDDSLPDNKENVSYKYFNMTDAEISKDHNWNRSKYILCNKENFKFLRESLNSNSEAVRKGEVLYYINDIDNSLYGIGIDGKKVEIK